MNKVYILIRNISFSTIFTTQLPLLPTFFLFLVFIAHIFHKLCLKIAYFAPILLEYSFIAYEALSCSKFCQLGFLLK